MSFDGSLNPMFDKNATVRVQKEKQNEPKVKRNQRVDKKHDIKIPLGEEVMKRLRKQAFRAAMSPTQYAAYLIRVGMKSSYNLFPVPTVPYNSEFKNVHAKLTKYEYSNLFDFQLEFGYTSQRKTAYRILVNMIYREQHGL